MSRITVKDVYEELMLLKASLKEKENVFLLPSPVVCQTAKWLCYNVSVQATVDLLSDFYGVETMNVIDPNSDKNKKGAYNGAVACYYSSEKTAYFTKQGFQFSTVCHEFFHHLVAQGKIRLRKEYEQKTADSFADEIEKRSV